MVRRRGGVLWQVSLVSEIPGMNCEQAMIDWAMEGLEGRESYFQTQPLARLVSHIYSSQFGRTHCRIACENWILDE